MWQKDLAEAGLNLDVQLSVEHPHYLPAIVYHLGIKVLNSLLPLVWLHAGLETMRIMYGDLELGLVFPEQCCLLNGGEVGAFGTLQPGSGARLVRDKWRWL